MTTPATLPPVTGILPRRNGGDDRIRETFVDDKAAQFAMFDAVFNAPLDQSSPSDSSDHAKGTLVHAGRKGGA